MKNAYCVHHNLHLSLCDTHSLLSADQPGEVQMYVYLSIAQIFQSHHLQTRWMIFCVIPDNRTSSPHTSVQ